jgi:glycerate kinase
MSRLHVLAAPDKFRGSATATEVAAAVAAGARRAGWDCRLLPMADGGEGTLEALGGPDRTTVVSGPDGQPVEAAWRLDGTTAVIEMATAAGLQLAGGAGANDALAATTRGVGELVAAALDAGATRVIIGVGGSATTDGGLGAVEVLEERQPLGGPGAHAQVVVAHDVRTLFTQAAAVFGPQKGAGPAEVEQLTQRLESLRADYLARYGVDVGVLPGSGAAGGLAGGLAALGARLAPGFDAVATEVGLAEAVAQADLVITGEGLMDPESFNGKVVGGVAALAEQTDTPVFVVAGQVRPEVRDRVPCVDLVQVFGEERSWAEPLACIEEAVFRHLGSLATNHAATGGT